MSLKNLQKELKSTKAIEECARQFGVVGDPTRLKICYLLCNYPELSVSEIANAVGVSISTTSHSIKKLKSFNLVKSRRKFRTVYYSLINNSFTKILKDFIT